MKVLTVGVSTAIRDYLRGHGIAAMFEDLASVEEVHDWIRDGAYDAVLVDLDHVSWGTMAVRYMRSRKLDIPFVALTQGNGDIPWSEQRALFLENGGDDFIRHPANPRELAASLHAATRRNQGRALEIVEFTYGAATVKVNLSLQQVWVNGLQPHMTTKEVGLVCLLARSHNRVVSKEAILSGLYQGIDEPELKIIDVFICKVRNKLEVMHEDAQHVIKTVWGRGYQMESGEKPEEAVAAVS